MVMSTYYVPGQHNFVCDGCQAIYKSVDKRIEPVTGYVMCQWCVDRGNDYVVKKQMKVNIRTPKNPRPYQPSYAQSIVENGQQATFNKIYPGTPGTDFDPVIPNPELNQ